MESTGPRWLGSKLSRYTAREAVTPTLVALLGLTALVLTKDLLEYSELIVNHGIGSETVAQIAISRALAILARILPFAVLIGSLVALGRMSADCEILSLETSGIPPQMLVWPIMLFAGAMTALSLVMSLAIAPWASRLEDALVARIARESPWASIRAGKENRFGDVRLDARELSSDGTLLEGVSLRLSEFDSTVFARSGEIIRAEDGNLVLSLRDGGTLEWTSHGAEAVHFGRMRTTLPEVSPYFARTGTDADPSRTLADLAARTESARNPRAALVALIHLHERFSLPLATACFGFLAVPILLSGARGSRARGAAIGIVTTVAYYGLVQLVEGLILGGAVPAPAGVWLPNCAILLLGSGLLIRSYRFEQPADAPPLRTPATRAASRGAERARRPHRYTLSRYVGLRFARWVLLSFALLFSAYLLVDVLERLGWFARYRATGLDILRFYGARIPLLASRAFPMAILMGSALAVSLMAQEGELLGMWTCGVSALRTARPILLVAVLFAPCYFAFNDVLLPYSNALADDLKKTEIKNSHPRENDASSGWFQAGKQVVQARFLDSDQGRAEDVTIYDLDDRLPVRRTDAPLARHIGNGTWRLDEPVRVEESEGRAVRVEAPEFVNLDLRLSKRSDTMHLSVANLSEAIDDVEAAGYDASFMRTDLHVKLSEPLVCIVLPALMVLVVLRGPPFQRPAAALLIAALLGVSFILLRGASSSLGHGRVLPPVLAAWSPIALYASMAGLCARRLRRHG